MSQEMQITIAAKDNASKVLQSIEQKVKNFGKDFGRQLVSIAGPMALVTMGLGKIQDYMADLAKRREEAFNWGASLTDSAAKMAVTVEQFQAIERAAQTTGESIENVGKAFKLANDLIQSAKAGNEEAIASLAAMGFTIAEVEKLKPQDVLRTLAGALAETEDPAKRGAAAVAALGESAKGLQDILARGFDIAGALESMEGLTKEEAAFLRKEKKKEEARANREKLKEAKRRATSEFLSSEEGQDTLNQVKPEIGKLDKIVSLAASLFPFQTGAKLAGPMVRAAGVYGASTNVGVQKESQLAMERIEKERLEKERKEREAAIAAAGGAPPIVAARGLLKKAEDDARRDKPKKKEKPEKPEKMAKEDGPTVSSLRAIGGGLAGEKVGSFDVQQMQLDVQKQIRDVLQDMNGKMKNPTDFTKPVIDGRVDLSGRTGVGFA